MENIKIDIEKNEKGQEIVQVQLNGRLDAQHSGSIEERLLNLITDGYTDFIIDMENTNYLGSSGIRIFLSLSNKLNEVEGKFKILNMPKTGIKILSTMEILDKFNLYQSKKEALDSF